MIPEFPEFKKLELSDREEIESFTKKFPPYSDFNFNSMWAWNINDDVRLSQLNNNLIVRFSDYVTGKPFYSFFGLSNIQDTFSSLLDLSKSENLSPCLKLISEEVIKYCNPEKFIFAEDRDHFDYILSVERLLPHDGTERKLSSRRKEANKFKNNDDVEVKLIDLNQSEVRYSINEVFSRWESQLSVSFDNIGHMKMALERFLSLGKFENMICVGVYKKNQLIGYSINEVLGNGYAIGHFQQGDVLEFSGIYGLLMHEVSPYLAEKKCDFINIEQDLNIAGLRSWKNSLNPVGFLKKYIVMNIN